MVVDGAVGNGDDMSKRAALSSFFLSFMKGCLKEQERNEITDELIRCGHAWRGEMWSGAFCSSACGFGAFVDTPGEQCTLFREW